MTALRERPTVVTPHAPARVRRRATPVVGAPGDAGLGRRHHAAADLGGDQLLSRPTTRSSTALDAAGDAAVRQLDAGLGGGLDRPLPPQHPPRGRRRAGADHAPRRSPPTAWPGTSSPATGSSTTRSSRRCSSRSSSPWFRSSSSSTARPARHLPRADPRVRRVRRALHRLLPARVLPHATGAVAEAAFIDGARTPASSSASCCRWPGRAWSASASSISSASGTSTCCRGCSIRTRTATSSRRAWPRSRSARARAATGAVCSTA